MRAILVASSLLLAAACAKAPKDKWVAQFEPAIVGAFCNPDWYFRSCFQIDDATCRATAKETIHTCLEQMKSQIPERLTTEEGGTYGGKIGECAGRTMEQHLVDKRHGTDPRCADPGAWTKPADR